MPLPLSGCFHVPLVLEDPLGLGSGGWEPVHIAAALTVSTWGLGAERVHSDGQGGRRDLASCGPHSRKINDLPTPLPIFLRISRGSISRVLGWV